jgi:hypothetical protein
MFPFGRQKKVAVIIPWVPGVGRGINFVRVKNWWEENFSFEVIISEGSYPINRGKVKNQGAAQTTADTLVFADADIIPTYSGIQNSLHWEAGLVYPYDELWMVAEDGSQAVERGHLGGLMTIEHKAFDLVGGFPEFPRWGGEDLIFEVCCDTLLGPTRRIEATATHLYHPSEERHWDQTQKALTEMYEAARGNENQIIEFIEGRKCVGL